MEINDPKQAALISTSIRVFCALGPMMGTQGLSDSQTDELMRLASEIHNATNGMVREQVGPILSDESGAFDAEMMTWAWLFDVLNHVESHANQARETYEQVLRARAARLN